MAPAKRSGALAAPLVLALGLLAGPAQAGPAGPLWDEGAWYLGAGAGPTRARIDEASILAALTAKGETAAIASDGRDTGFKLYAGKSLGRHLALEAGYFDLGRFSYRATTSGKGVLNGEAAFRGVNLDLVGRLPLSWRLAAFARLGIQHARATDHFTGNRLLALTNPNPTESAFNPKAGLGLELRLSEALAVRAEAERYRVNDAIGNRGDVDMLALNLVYRLGRRAPAPDVKPAPPELPQAPAEPAPLPGATPVPVTEKFSFAAAALFDFDKAVVKPRGKAALAGLLRQLEGMEAEVMITVGHTDSIGTERYNDKLSLRRAAAVKAYLVSAGVEAGRVFVEGRGELAPVADNRSAAGRAQNRRVTVEVVGTRTAPK